MNAVDICEYADVFKMHAFVGVCVALFLLLIQFFPYLLTDTKAQIIATNIDKKNRKSNPLGCFHVLAKVTVCISMCVHQQDSGLKVQVSVYNLQK